MLHACLHVPHRLMFSIMSDARVLPELSTDARRVSGRPGVRRLQQRRKPARRRSTASSCRSSCSTRTPAAHPSSSRWRQSGWLARGRSSGPLSASTQPGSTPSWQQQPSRRAPLWKRLCSSRKTSIENKIACLATEIEQVSSTLFQDSMQSKTEKHVLAAVRPGAHPQSMLLLHCTSVQPCALLVSKEGLHTVALARSRASANSQHRLRTRTW